MRVLFVAPFLGGGVAASLAVLTHQLKARGITSVIFTHILQTDRFAEERGVEVRTGRRPELAPFLLRQRPDVVNATAFAAHDRILGPILRTFARAGGRVVVSSRSSRTVDLRHFRAKAFTAVSASAAQALRAPPGSEVQIIPNAADTALFRPWSEAQPTSRPPVAWVGRSLGPDWRSKDALGFLYLAASESLRAPAHEFVMVDQTDQAEELGLRSWLRASIDYRPNLRAEEMARFYRWVGSSGGAMLSTSRDEGFPVNVLEAWASGCPVIVPRVPGMEAVSNEENGLVYDRSEGFEGPRRCLQQLSDPALRQRLIEGGLSAIRERYCPERVGEAYERLFRGLLGA